MAFRNTLLKADRDEWSCALAGLLDGGVIFEKTGLREDDAPMAIYLMDLKLPFQPF